ncbi:hypothetical protein BDQ17DRAFT_1548026 [Cyathus striatus]|nr:hypothetical protein BDQ17DRAFT_1548026 [Cyathus striatus]
MLTAWSVDALLMWRFMCIYQDIKLVKQSILMFSVLLQIASVVTGSFALRNLSTGTSSNYQFTIYFEAISLLHNLIMTCLIVGRLLFYRRRVRRVLGRHHGQDYLSIAAMLAESQGILVIGQALMIGFGFIRNSANSSVVISVNDSPLQYSTSSLLGAPSTIYPILAQLQVLAPVILIYRVMQGKVCDAYKIAEVTKTIGFAVSDQDNTHISES